jgi:hypothetical protein
MRNRQAGHKYELDIAKAMRKAGFEHVVSSRSANRARDAQKIDLVNEDEGAQGRLPYNIQCKTICGSFNYAKILEEIPQVPDTINVVLRKATLKSTGGKFITKGKYAFLSQDDFLSMVSELHRLKTQYESNN